MKLIKKTPFLILSVILLLALHFLPFFYYSSQTPKDRVYLGAEHYYPDYYAYLFYVSQGIIGRTSVLDFFTNEPHKGSFVHAEYLLLGKAGSFLNFPPQTTYYLSRSLLLIIFILVSYWFIGLFIKSKPLKNMTLLLSFLWDGLIITTALNFYQPPNLFTRLTYEPHKLIGMTLTLVALYALSQKKIFLTIILCLLIGFLHGASAITLALTLILYFLISRKRQFNLFFPLIFLTLPLLYWQYIFTSNKVWHQMALMEKNFSQIDIASPPIPIILSWLFILGPLIILLIIGLKKFIIEKKDFSLLVISYLISNIFLFFGGFLLISTARARYYQTPYLLFLSIAAVFGIISLIEKIKFKNKTLLTVIVISLLILQSIPNSLSSLKTILAQFGPKNNLDIIAYPPKKWYETLVWLKNTPKDSIILSLRNAGQIIPTLPGRRVVVGDTFHSHNYNQKLSEVKNFFSGNLSLNQAKAYLQKEHVNYVFYGLEEKNYGNLNQYSSILQKVFENEDASVYKVTF